MLREIHILRTARDPKRRDPGWVKDRVGCDVTGSASRIDILLAAEWRHRRETHLSFSFLINIIYFPV